MPRPKMTHNPEVSTGVVAGRSAPLRYNPLCLHKLDIMPDNRILFISQEIAPYLPAGELSDFGRAIAQNAQSHKFEVRTFMPRFGSINERRNQLHEVIRLSGLNIPINDADHPLIIKVASLQPSRIQVYFIDNDDFFQKLASDVDPVGSNRADNDERAMFFARGTMETVKKLRWEPAVVFCTGWMSALNPLYLRQCYSDDLALRKSKVIYCITDDKLATPVDPAFFDKLKFDKLPKKVVDKYRNLPLDTDLLHHIAIDNSDAVVIMADSVSDDIEKFIAEKKLPVFRFPKGGELDLIYDFYKQLTDDK